MSDCKNIVPQVGRTDGLESHPEQDLGSPSDSGGGKLQTENELSIVLMESMSRLTKLSQELIEQIELYPDTSEEIKEASVQLKEDIDTLNSIPIEEWFEEIGEESIDKQMCDVEVQTTCLWNTPEDNILGSLNGINTLEKWHVVEGKIWEMELFTNTEVVIGNPLNTDDAVVKTVIVEPNDVNMEMGIQRLYRDICPELQILNGEFEVVEQMITIRSREPKYRKIIKMTYNGTDKDLWDKIQMLKEETQDKEKVAIPYLTNMTTGRLKKMIEAIFHGSKTKVYLFTQVTIHVQKERPKKQRKKNTYGIVVEEENKSYLEILRSAKALLKDVPANQIIRSLTSTRHNKLLITTDKNEEKFNELLNILINAPGDLKVRTAGSFEKTETQIIQRTRTDTQKEEVIPAAGNYEMRSYACNTSTASSTTQNEDDNKMLQDQQTKIGIVSSCMKKGIKLDRCFKCLSYDHQVPECESLNRTMHCFRCRKEENTAKEFAKEVCPICKKTGHKAVKHH